MSDDLQERLLTEIGGGCRDEEDLIKCFNAYPADSIITALDRLRQRNKLNTNTTAGHTSYAKPGNEPWKESKKTGDSSD